MARYLDQLAHSMCILVKCRWVQLNMNILILNLKLLKVPSDAQCLYVRNLRRPSSVAKIKNTMSSGSLILESISKKRSPFTSVTNFPLKFNFKIRIPLCVAFNLQITYRICGFLCLKLSLLKNLYQKLFYIPFDSLRY